MTTPAEFRRKMDRVATVVPRVLDESTRQAAGAAKTLLQAEGTAARIPSRKRWGVRYTMRPVARGRGGATVFYWGAAPYWTEFGTSAHLIAPKGAIKRRAYRAATITAALFGGDRAELARGVARSGRGALSIDGELAAFARHPGARPRPFFRGAAARAAVVVSRVYRSAARRSLVGAGLGR